MFLGFAVTYMIDPIAKIYMKEQSIDPTSIEDLSKRYVRSLGISIDEPIKYRFVRYQHENEDEVLLGTFHKWNNTYYIDISVDLYKSSLLDEVVVHETRHMIVAYLHEKNIIDLVKYTEEIAQEKNSYYNSLFDSGVYLLKESQKES